MIKYIGSKRLLLPKIVAAAHAFEDVSTVLDLFSGTSRVGHALKKAGFSVTANDHLSYAATLARCYVGADRGRWESEASALIDELNQVEPQPGYFTETFCEKSRFLQPENGARVDAIRNEIAARKLPAPLEAIALTSLMEAADRVDSTTGVQMAYLKSWAARAHQPLSMRLPDFLPGEGRAIQGEALSTAREVEVDLAYLDPPYNQHSYMGNYHMWETLVRWDEPEHYGVACKRTDCREYSSDFNSKRRIQDAFARLVPEVRAKHLLVSFNNEGYLSRDDLVEILATRGRVGVVAVDYKRYVGAKIGIYNPSGEKVGKVSHVRNKELLFVVSESQTTVDRVVAAIEQAS